MSGWQRKRSPTGFDFTKLPILGEIALTYRCNNSCACCYSRCKPDNSAHELCTSDVKQIIDAFKTRAKLPFFSFTGGEPLLRDDLEELIRYAVSAGLSVNLITNGTLATAKRQGIIFCPGLDTAQESVESPFKPVQRFAHMHRRIVRPLCRRNKKLAAERNIGTANTYAQWP